jgi:hypothetical protein
VNSIVQRIAADGSVVTLSVPAEAGAMRWFGATRVVGPAINRSFGLAQAGQHKVIPKKIFPGGRVQAFRRVGFDLVLYEASDRSDSCLVWAGPYNEVTTWFGGPAPREAVLDHLVSLLLFTDSPSGARFGPDPAASLEQQSTRVYGWADDVVLMIRDARTSRDQLPPWRGLTMGDAELWKERLDLGQEQAEELAGSPFEWRYVMASPTAVTEIIFPLQPGAYRAAAASALARVDAVVQGVRASWSG